jgi:hypothetical protein
MCSARQRLSLRLVDERPTLDYDEAQTKQKGLDALLQVLQDTNQVP